MVLATRESVRYWFFAGEEMIETRCCNRECFIQLLVKEP